ncbi:autotransporter outer membrane beta-barrel domain-containing protein [Pandoraea anapnoica]|uniref:Autotransporter outer membrane beta-barrel domain-containing protein n=1 Tax=Pandoraea anapnoica TaxID=2508301 RepID=A0A5E5A4K9_9BURK|nr:autotransporter domain-containing protein [Pandoraea anapnoica]VVE68166.1 autotransporter outer membrane beta-barrel domain-containing protein [Pandoraea anapnoica]
MNHVHCIVWSASLGMYQVASEIAAGRGRTSRSVDRRARRVAVAAAAALTAASGSATGQVQAGTVTNGDGSDTQIYIGAPAGGFPLSLPWEWDGTNLHVFNTGARSATLSDAFNAVTIDPAGTLTGAGYGLAIFAGSGGTVNNNGLISGSQYGVTVGGELTQLVNNGTITGGASAVQSNGTIHTITNTGTMRDGLNGINVTSLTVAAPAVTDVINNSGTLSGIQNGLLVAGGRIGTINNTRDGTTIGTIDGGIQGINNTSNGTVWGSIGRVQNDGVIHGATIGIANDQRIDTVHNGAQGTISGDAQFGIQNVGNINAIENGGLISGGQVGISGTAGTLWSITNAGTITGGTIGVLSAGSIVSLSNSGLIMTTGTVAGRAAVLNAGSIVELSNSGVIAANAGSGDAAGFHNAQSIFLLTNLAGGTISGDYGVLNKPTSAAVAILGTISNRGLITGASAGVNNVGGTIALLNNTNTIQGTGNGTSVYGVVNANTVIGGTTYGGSIVTLANYGLIRGVTGGIDNTGVISKIRNVMGGRIDGGATGIAIRSSGAGNIGTISNENGGVISGATAIQLDGGTIGQISNAGTILGNVKNFTAADLTISGASSDGIVGQPSSTGFGTLSGYGGTVGTISNPLSNVQFWGGKLVLNDNVQLGNTFTMYNTGATLHLDRAITISGNFQQNALGTLEIGVGSDATTTGSPGLDDGYGRLLVRGSTTLAAGSTIAFQSMGYNFAVGQRYIVIDTSGTANYNEGSLVYRVNGSTTLSAIGANVANGSNQDLVVTVVDASTATGGNNGGNSGGTGGTSSLPDARASATIASVPNALSALRGLLGYTGIGSAPLLHLFNATLGALGNNSTALANRVGKQLAPTQHVRAAGAATFDSMSVVNSRVNGLRLASAGGTGVATGDVGAGWGAWGQAFGGHASQSERESVDGYSANYGGLIVGVDRAFGERWRAGGAFQFSRTVINNDGSTSGNNTNVNAYGLIGYAGYTGEPWYVNLSGAAVMQRYNATRFVSMLGFDGAATGSFNGQQYVGSAEFGWPLALGRAVVTPLASLTYSHMNQSGYTETGGNGAALSVGGTNANSVRSALGVRLGVPFETSSGTWMPELTVRWVHEYNRTGVATGASFAADPVGQTGFTTVGATPVSNLADIALGLTLVRANNMSASIRYNLQAGSGFVSHTGIVRVQQRF